MKINGQYIEDIKTMDELIGLYNKESNDTTVITMTGINDDGAQFTIIEFNDLPPWATDALSWSHKVINAVKKIWPWIKGWFSNMDKRG
jgi:hypothetical protein